MSGDNQRQAPSDLFGYDVNNVTWGDGQTSLGEGLTSRSQDVPMQDVGSGVPEGSVLMYLNDPDSLFSGFADLPAPAPDTSDTSALVSTMESAFSVSPHPPSANAASVFRQLSNGGGGPSDPNRIPRGINHPSIDNANNNNHNTISTTSTTIANIGTIDDNRPGAGPDPLTDIESSATAAGVTSSGGVTLTEFTRRKNWSSKVVEELCDLFLIIEPNSRLRFVSPSVTALLGYSVNEAVGKTLNDLLHEDDRAVFTAELNACIGNASVMRMFHRLRRRDGEFSVFESVGRPHIAEPRFAANPTNKSPFCQAVFLMARPYPIKNSSLIDTFLEHKMENERLRKRIDDLRREEATEDLNDEMSQSQGSSRFGQTQSASSHLGVPGPYMQPSGIPGQQPLPGMNLAVSLDATMMNADANTAMAMGMNMAGMAATSGNPTLMGGLRNSALTRENLEGMGADRQDSLRGKMARYEGMMGSGRPDSLTSLSSLAGATQNSNQQMRTPGLMGTTTHQDTIEMLTGLRYQEGERSQGLSTGNRSPRLVKGDVGIALPTDREQRSGEKKKKLRLAEEYVCTDCGTLESPEWRKGPNGPKTLCNACGLRWAKKEKKERKEKKAIAESSPP